MERSDRDRRASAVAKLKRAASLPRMKDGRRPPMHNEANSDPENNLVNTPSTESPPYSRPPTQEPPENESTDSPPPPQEVAEDSGIQNNDEPSFEVEGEGEGDAEADVDTDFVSVTPEPGATAKKRRKRSHSRSRSRRNSNARKSPGPPSEYPDESSQDESAPGIASPLPVHLQIQSPMFAHPFDLSRLIRSPTPGAMTPTPQGSMLPTLQQLALDRGLTRSHSERNAKDHGRSQALSKLTGGQDTEYEDNSTPVSPTSPGVHRSNTYGGEQRMEARTNLLKRLANRPKTPVGDLDPARIHDNLPASPIMSPAMRSSPMPLPALSPLPPILGSPPILPSMFPPSSSPSLHMFASTSPPPFQSASPGPGLFHCASPGPGFPHSTSPHPGALFYSASPPPEGVSPVPSPAPEGKKKRPRRRSKAGKSKLPGDPSDSEYQSSRPNTPMNQEMLGMNGMRVQSPVPTPKSPFEPERMRSPITVGFEPEPAAISDHPSEYEHEPAPPQKPKRRSIVVEQDDFEDDRANTFENHATNFDDLANNFGDLPTNFEDHTNNFEDDSANNLPMPPPVTPPGHRGQRIPYSSDPLSQISSENNDLDGSHVPVYLETHADETKSIFPRSPFAPSYQERAPHVEEDELDVLRLRTQDDARSWVSHTPSEKRMPLDEEEEDEDEYEDDVEVDVQVRDNENEPRYSQGFAREHYDLSAPGSATSSKSLVIEDSNVDRPPESDRSQSPSTAYPISTIASPRPEFGSMHPEFDNWEDVQYTQDAPSPPPSTWNRMKHTLKRSSSLGRHSRGESMSRPDFTDSSASRESGVSQSSGRGVSGGEMGTPQPMHQSPPVSATASGSVLSLAAPRPGHSPMPSASVTDLSKYQDSKLFPFPGLHQLEQNQRSGTNGAASANGVYGSDGQAHRSTSSLSNTLGPDIQGRERKLSHQASDSQLLNKFNGHAYPPSSFSPPLPEQIQRDTSQGSKLPSSLADVKKWLNKSKKKPSISSPPLSPDMVGNPVLQQGQPPSLSNLLGVEDRSTPPPWEEKTTPTTLANPAHSAIPLEPTSSFLSSGTSVTQVQSSNQPQRPSADVDASYLNFDQPNSDTPPEPSSDGRLQPFSWEKYPHLSSSSSSSSLGVLTPPSLFRSQAPGQQGERLLERLEESLHQGGRSPMWSSVVDEPPRKLILSSPVLQVVNSNTVKDRFLFLFTDILVIAKPVMQEKERTVDAYEWKATVEKKFIIKAVVQLNRVRFSDGRADSVAKSGGLAGSLQNPVLKTFPSHFSRDPDLALTSLCKRTGLPEEPVVIMQILFRVLDLDRGQVGEYLSRRSSRSVLRLYLDNFGFAGLRIDKALRAFMLSINLEQAEDGNARDYVLDVFASRWYEANAGIVPYDRDMAVRLVQAIVQLNEVLHGYIASEPGATGFPHRNITVADFTRAFRPYDPRLLISDDYLEQIYESIRYERLVQACITNHGSAIPISIKNALPSRLTYKIQSEPIILRIPQPDPQLYIHLHGQDLVFEPKVLSFAKSSQASFRVTGMSLGPKTILLTRSAPNALRYSGLPLSQPVTIERAFMRNTFQVAFSDLDERKRRYMFSVDDPLKRHQWAVSLRGHISMASAANSKSEFNQAADSMAFQVLQKTLFGLDEEHRMPSSDSLHANGRSWPSHSRSKSRSHVYHRFGAGRNELDLMMDQADQQDSSLDSGSSRVNGKVWTGQEIETHCRQNSSIPLVLSYLQAGSPAYEISTPQSV